MRQDELIVSNCEVLGLQDERRMISDIAENHIERKLQGLDNELIVPIVRPPEMETEFETTKHLSGLIRSY